MLVRGAAAPVLVGVLPAMAGAQQAAAATSAAPTVAPALASAAHPLVFDGVTVVDVEHGKSRAEQRVVILGNRIRALGPARTVRVPAGARVVDARGKYLIPGLWDMHIHPARHGTAGTGPAMADAVYRQLLANGVTGIRDAGSPIALDTFRVWKQEIAAGRRVGPRLIVSGPALEMSQGECTRDHHPTPPCYPHFVYIGRAQEAGPLVDSIKAAGADMLKIHDVPRALWFALAAAARRVGLPFGGHFSTLVFDDPLPRTVDGLVASDSGARILDHRLYADACGSGQSDSLLSLTRCAAAAARLRRNHTWMTPFTGPGGPPLFALPDSFQLRALRYTLPSDREAKDAKPWQPLTAVERRQLPTGADWAAAWARGLGDSVDLGSTQGCQLAQLRYAARLPWLPGTDWPFGAPPGIGVHLSLLEPVLCGVPPLWVLQAATLEPARALGLTDSLGTVAVGKVADLVLLEGDPLDDIWNVSKIGGVLANGRYFDRAALDRLLVEADAEWATVRRRLCAAVPKDC